MQRARFLPAIELLKQHLDVLNVDGGVDYRLRYLEKAEIYHYPLDNRAEQILNDVFTHIAPEPGHRGGDLEIEGRFIPTLREADGLAMSSRNGYLTPVERAQAPQLHRELATLAAAVGAGERAYDTLVATARRRLNMAGWRVDYITVRDAATLTAPTVATTHAVVLGAAWLGKTRLSDNLECALPNLPLGDPG